MDEREFDELYVSSYPRLTAQLYAMVGDRDEAEECVQEAFVRAWQHRGKRLGCVAAAGGPDEPDHPGDVPLHRSRVLTLRVAAVLVPIAHPLNIS
jgi:hypothetical protein